MKLKTNNLVENHSRLILFFIVIAAAVLRIFFFTGMVFSDDAYYNQLAISLFNGNYPGEYIGYPIFLLRKFQTFLTSAGFFVLGTNEAGSILFPYLFSVASIPLIYIVAKSFSSNRTIALISAFLLAIFPMDIICATLNFPDLIAAFFLNLGIFFLYKHHISGKIYLSVLAGFSFSLSLFLKINFVFIAVLLFLLLAFSFFKRKRIEAGIMIALGIPFAALLFEALLYNFFQSDFLYRLHIMRENFSYAYYDFFPNNLIVRKELADNYTSALLLQWYLNIKSIFVRRFYLFLPAIALVQSFLSIRKKEDFPLTFWFIGLIVLYLFFTSSFTAYIPLDLTSGWYIYPLFFPAIILSSYFIYSQRRVVQIILIFLIMLFSLAMTFKLQDFFDESNNDKLIKFLEDKNSAIIYTDHHTSYGINLIDGYPGSPRTKIFTGKDFSFKELNPGDMIIFNADVVEELKLQKHSFPDFMELQQPGFIETAKFGKFKVYIKKNFDLPPNQ